MPSTFLREIAIKNGLNSARVSVLPNYTRFGVPPATPATGRNILFVGRFTPEKGVLRLAAALNRLTTADWTATFVGGGPLEGELRRHLETNALLSRVSFEPWAGNAALGGFYRQAAVVVVPSIMPESFVWWELRHWDLDALLLVSDLAELPNGSGVKMPQSELLTMMSPLFQTP